jgi:hypothetical protein
MIVVLADRCIADVVAWISQWMREPSLRRFSYDGCIVAKRQAGSTLHVTSTTPGGQGQLSAMQTAQVTSLFSFSYCCPLLVPLLLFCL